MATRKYFYYVLVMTNSGPVFVTGIPERNWANYNKDEKPMEFGSKSYAQEVANGLCMNFQQAYMITSQWEIERQPYRYNDGHFEWHWEDEKDD